MKLPFIWSFTKEQLFPQEKFAKLEKLCADYPNGYYMTLDGTFHRTCPTEECAFYHPAAYFSAMLGLFREKQENCEKNYTQYLFRPSEPKYTRLCGCEVQLLSVILRLHGCAAAPYALSTNAIRMDLEDAILEAYGMRTRLLSNPQYAFPQLGGKIRGEMTIPYRYQHRQLRPYPEEKK